MSLILHKTIFDLRVTTSLIHKDCEKFQSVTAKT